MKPTVEFFLIIIGGFIGSILGSVFGSLIAIVSPDFIDLMTHPIVFDEKIRMGAAMGMIGGLLIGALAMAVGRIIGALRFWATSHHGPK